MSVGSDTLSGAAQGASLGSVAGPYGAVIGGIIGAGAGLFSGVKKKNERDEAAKKVKRPDYQIPKEIFQNQAMYDAMSKSSRVPGQAYIENQLNQNTAQAISASQKSAGSSAEALSNIANIQRNANEQTNVLGLKGAEYQMMNKDKLAAANENLADFKQQAFDYNQNQPYQIAFAQNQKLQDQNRMDNQNMVNDVQALTLLGKDTADKFKTTGSKNKKVLNGNPALSQPTYNYKSYSDLNLG